MPALTRPQKITFGEMRSTGARGLVPACAESWILLVVVAGKMLADDLHSVFGFHLWRSLVRPNKVVRFMHSSSVKKGSESLTISLALSSVQSRISCTMACAQTKMIATNIDRAPVG
jgi:hypothetical protein